MKEPRHVLAPLPCPSCALKLEGAHEVIREWYLKLRVEFPDAHISWAFRPKEIQDLFVRMHKSSASWPRSKHNAMRDGKPCARAMDLFQLVDDLHSGSPAAVARFPMAWFRSIRDWLIAQEAPILWGGEKALMLEGEPRIDGDHFELKKTVSP